MPHGKPDWKNSRFGLFIGTALHRLATPFSEWDVSCPRHARVHRTRTSTWLSRPSCPCPSHAAGDNNRWLPIKPTTDLALVMGMIRWIIDNERYDVRFLSQPDPSAMAAGEAAWSNARHLLINDAKHPRYGQFLRGATWAALPEPVWGRGKS